MRTFVIWVKFFGVTLQSTLTSSLPSALEFMLCFIMTWTCLKVTWGALHYFLSAECTLSIWVVPIIYMRVKLSVSGPLRGWLHTDDSVIFMKQIELLFMKHYVFYMKTVMNRNINCYACFHRELSHRETAGFCLIKQESFESLQSWYK